MLCVVASRRYTKKRVLHLDKAEFLHYSGQTGGPSGVSQRKQPLLWLQRKSKGFCKRTFKIFKKVNNKEKSGSALLAHGACTLIVMLVLWCDVGCLRNWV